MDRTTACGGRSLTSCRKAAPVLAGGMPCTFCGCSSVGRARPRHVSWGSGPRVRDSSSAPLRVCPCTPRPRDRVLVVRDVRGPWPDHVQRDTTSDGTLALGHSRSGTFSPWLSRQGSRRCKRQAARSISCRGHQQPCRVRLDGRGHHPFKVGTRVRIPHATPEQGTSVELTLRGWKPAATIGRRRNPSPDGSRGGVAQHPVEQPPCERQATGSNPVTSTTWPGLVNSAARVPACLAGSRGFDSRTGRQSQSPR